MATATSKPQAARTARTTGATKKPQAARAPRSTGGGRSAPSEFRVFENNAGDFQWVITSKDGTMLAQSRPFASFAAAQAGAVAVRDGAAAARFEGRAAASPRAHA